VILLATLSRYGIELDADQFVKATYHLTDTAVILLATLSRYGIELDADQFVKATYHLTDPKNAEIFLALKDMEHSQEMWLKTCINKE
jgi:hypothetical protein